MPKEPTIQQILGGVRGQRQHEQKERARRQQEEASQRRQRQRLEEVLGALQHCEPGQFDPASGESITVENLGIFLAQRIVDLAHCLKEQHRLERLDRLPGEDPAAQLVRQLVRTGVRGKQERIALALQQVGGPDQFEADVNDWLRVRLPQALLAEEWPPPGATAQSETEPPLETGDPRASEGADETPAAKPARAKTRATQAARLAHWAFAMESANRWHLFRRVMQDGRPHWRLQRRVQGLGRGKLPEILEKFAEGEGFVSRAALTKLLCHVPLTERKRYKGQVLSPLSRLRKVIGANLDLGAIDPVPWVEAEQGWRTALEVGYAVRDDDQWQYRKHSEIAR